MKDNVLLMIVLAFISGFMLQGIMKNMCGRLVEGAANPPVGDGSVDSVCFNDSQCNGSAPQTCRTMTKLPCHCNNGVNGIGNGTCKKGCSLTDTEACPIAGQTCSLSTRTCVDQSSGEQLAGRAASATGAEVGKVLLSGMKLLS